MFGKNEVIKQDLTRGDALRVKEIFFTIQGEGPNAGERAVFIRLHGCNLRCFFCDTDFEGEHQVMSVNDVMHAVSSYIDDGLVVITGGEPMLQNITPLCEELLKHSYLPQVETAGTVWVPDLSDDVQIVCSPKTPRVHPMIEERCRHWKYIIRAGEQSVTDGLPNGSTQIDGMAQTLYRPPIWMNDTIYVQPMDEDTQANNIQAAVGACMKYGYRLSMQVHKIVGVE